ncbi:fungal-specific transcription factor domain-containing protein [Pseudoneurospora amorphoporcata]|uniref:Fungal-specific transcription factor domain-containing protein n=1 Tax=Pseudoneurospora amorphoporcata TaxID=241081 RepID=A0AAN6SEP0_9PEZI|nr:fungal-specific transcription factor domain-containing protein [Pseudoneurospora amorphoporcata]
MENIINFPENTKLPCFLPDRETAQVLVESYFTNTRGLIEVFDKSSFCESVEMIYADPLSASTYSTCHLFLVLALGLLLSAPQPGSREDEIIKKLYSAKQDMAELFFRSAKSMCDPEYGFEDADFWSIQALCLMTVYMLTVSKRNTAYAYLGMAVRSAYALGLHREETMHPLIYPELTQREVRRNLWKTLFILDRFLAASLGRPVAIVEDDCSCKLTTNDDIADLSTVGGNGSESLHFGCLDACVKSCRVIGVTLRVFSKRKISIAVVQDIANMAKYWRRPSLSNLTPQQSREGPTSPEQGIAALHANLLSLHSLILLTRQIFIMHNWKLDQQRSGKAKPPSNRESHMAKFSEACVVASYQSIHLIQQAREDGYLPQRNPFFIYFLFAASLIVLMNQFASLYYSDTYTKTITDAISTMKYCAEIDPQAERVLEIMESFAQVVETWTKDHSYPAPVLSADLSCLYTKSSSSRMSRENGSSAPSIPSPLDPAGSRMGSISHQPAMTSPPLPRPQNASDVFISPPSATVPEVMMNGMSAVSSTTPPMAPPLALRPGHITHSPPDVSDEWKFDDLWNNWLQPAPHVSTAPELANIAPQFLPPSTTVSSDPYESYPLRVNPHPHIPPSGIRGSVPIYHMSNMG